MQTLIVGDIHGCWQEFADLLDKVGLASGDRIVATGDIIDRGPNPGRVLEFFQSRIEAHSVMGNHERKHVRSFRREIPPALSQRIAREQLGVGYTNYVDFMAQFPLYIDLPEALVVHGFFEPGVPLEAQRDVVLVGTMTGAYHLKKNYDQPWYELYEGDKPIVVGHLNYRGDGQPLICKDRVFGIDTSCCRGGNLTGLLLPEFQLLSVPAREDHWTSTRRVFAHMIAGQAEVVRKKKQRSAPPRWETVEELKQRFEEEIREEERSLLEKRIEEVREAESRIPPLMQSIRKECARLMAELEEEAGKGSSSRELGRHFDLKVNGHPLRSLFHQARQNRLEIESIQRFFSTPGELLAFVEERDMGVTDER